MAKVKAMTIEEMIKAKEAEITRLQVFKVVVEKVEDYVKWEFGEAVYDENGQIVYEDEDNMQMKFNYPKEGDWNYDRYAAAVGILDEIKAII